MSKPMTPAEQAAFGAAFAQMALKRDLNALSVKHDQKSYKAARNYCIEYASGVVRDMREAYDEFSKGFEGTEALDIYRDAIGWKYVPETTDKITLKITVKHNDSYRGTMTRAFCTGYNDLLSHKATVRRRLPMLESPVQFEPHEDNKGAPHKYYSATVDLAGKIEGADASRFVMELIRDHWVVEHKKENE